MRSSAGLRHAVVGWIAALSAACAAEPETRTLRIATHSFEVEVADTPAQRQHGLMARERLATNGGMLFVFDAAGEHCFWMRNTPLPLSIAFIDESSRVVGLADMQPQSEALHCPTQPVRYALEIAQGGFAQRAIVPGMRVEGLPGSGRHR